jgi:hypothetical protein
MAAENLAHGISYEQNVDQLHDINKYQDSSESLDEVYYPPTKKSLQARIALNSNMNTWGFYKYTTFDTENHQMALTPFVSSCMNMIKHHIPELSGIASAIIGNFANPISLENTCFDGK